MSWVLRKKMIQIGMGKKLRPRRSWEDIIKASLAFCNFTGWLVHTPLKFSGR